jgi:hypothetical protein
MFMARLLAGAFGVKQKPFLAGAMYFRTKTGKTP